MHPEQLLTCALDIGEQMLLSGAEIGRVSDVPYSLSVDLSAYKGQTITLTATAYDSTGAVCATKSYTLIVK